MKKRRRAQNNLLKISRWRNIYDIKVTTGIKLKYLSGKQNEYDTNQLLGESPLEELIELDDMKNQFGNTVVNTT